MPQPIKKRREAPPSCKGSLDGLDLALLDRGTMAVKQPKDCPRDGLKDLWVFVASQMPK